MEDKSNLMEFKLRTESIRDNEIQNLFVENTSDRKVINLFKSQNPVIAIGSRGVGKSFLMKVATKEIKDNFLTDSIIPIYITFRESSLLFSNDQHQFRNWMLAKIIYNTLKTLRKNAIVATPLTYYLDSGSDRESERKLNKIIKAYELSYQNPDESINISSLPTIEDLLEAFEEICQESNINRFCIFFDEAAHIFRPSQQRSFFSIFREIRSPYVSCNAAVYPGVTHFGDFFDKIHDTTFCTIERSILDDEYIDVMKSMVFKQLKDKELEKLENNYSYFESLALCSAGNPRLLFKTIVNSEKFSSQSINSSIKQTYKNDIWAEHTQLGEKYTGYKSLVDWGRNFIENTVLKLTVDKNNRREEHSESTIYFRIHKDVPEFVKESLRLLCYTGIIKKLGDAVRGSHNFVGSKYEIKFGCVLSLNANPINYTKKLYDNLTSSLISEFGMNNSAYSNIPDINVQDLEDENSRQTIQRLLSQPTSVLELTSWQKNKLIQNGFPTINSILETTEEELINKIYYVNIKRARTIYNAATAELLEYLAG